jgi:3-carboxy-cis,cis-muconate cycloisomerase
LPFDALFVPAPLREATGDQAWLDALLEFEQALARVTTGADLGTPDLDAVAIAEAGRASGTPVVPLVAQLGAGAHQGATSQDAMDTAAVLVARRALALIDAELAGVAAACAALAAEHRSTPMAARTLLQQALPTSFGL